MALFLSLLPIYLFGNIHCLGMCGPLVMMLGQHRFRYLYFLGRILSFTLAGILAAEAGAIFNLILKSYHLPALTSLLFGFFLLLMGFFSFNNIHFPGSSTLSRLLAKTNRTLSLLILQDRAWPTFLFGFLTVALPCGQTIIVFSACALFGDGWVGLANGAAFAILTSPSLFFAMHAHSFLHPFKNYYRQIVGFSALLVGTLSICRGLADLNWIDHWTLSEHLVIF